MLSVARMKTLVLLLVALPCVAKPVDAERLSKLLGLHGQSTPDVSAPATPLPFRLLGTLRGARPLVALAATTRVITATIGDVVAGVEIVTIERLEITVRRAGRLERLSFSSIVEPTPLAPRLTRAMLQQQLSNPAQLMGQVRLVPRFSGGKWAGFKALSVQRDSLVERLGLRSGDVIKAVNGVTIDTPERLLDLSQQLQRSRHFTVELERDGQPLAQPVILEE